MRNGAPQCSRFAINIKSTNNKNPQRDFFVYTLGEKVAFGQHHAFSPARVTFYINVSLLGNKRQLQNFSAEKLPAGSATGTEINFTKK